MRASKKFVVIAYDISATKRKNKVVKILQKYGTRVNLSVFECMMTASQLMSAQEEIQSLIKPGRDQVIFYPLCLDCYAKITYHPSRRTEKPDAAEII